MGILKFLGNKTTHTYGALVTQKRISPIGYRLRRKKEVISAAHSSARMPPSVFVLG